MVRFKGAANGFKNSKKGGEKGPPDIDLLRKRKKVCSRGQLFSDLNTNSRLGKKLQKRGATVHPFLEVKERRRGGVDLSTRMKGLESTHRQKTETKGGFSITNQR